MAMNLNDDMQRLNKLIESIIAKSEKNIVVNYAKTLEGLRTSIRKLCDKYADKDSKLSFAQMNKGNRLNDFEKDITQNIAKLYKNNSNLIKATLDNVFITTKDKTIDSVEANKPKKVKSLLSIKKEIDIDKTVNEKMAGLHWSERMGHHRNNVIYNVNSTLKAGLAQGSTYKEMSDVLSKSLNGDVLQPMRIIRTESARVYSSTKMQSLDKCAKAGIEMVKIWHSVKDERVRTQHSQMDGVTVDYEDDFTLPDGTKTKAPCLSGVAKHDIHCRCFITTDLKEFYKDKDIQKSTNEKNNEYTVQKIQEKGYNDNIKKDIKQNYNLKINQGRQDKHIRGTNNYNQDLENGKKKSYLLDNIDPQELIYRYSGTGEFRRNSKTGKWINKEFVQIEENIGYYVNPITKSKILTNRFAIHYSKEKGTHIVPAKPIERNDKNGI